MADQPGDGSAAPVDAEAVPPCEAGVLLPLHSLPHGHGIGDLGASARAFIDLLATSGNSVWQLLPLHPPANEAWSPYDATSAHAGFDLLISLDGLVAIGLLESELLAAAPANLDIVDYWTVATFKRPRIEIAARELLRRSPADTLHLAFVAFCEREESWLEPYAAFELVRTRYGDSGREQWRREDRIRATSSAPTQIDLTTSITAAIQFFWWRQFGELRAYAHAHDVKLFGDVPIYVGGNSADVWASPELWELNDNGCSDMVSGVAPDHLEGDGQKWGMPVYRWQQHHSTGYSWWIERMRRAGAAFDIVRLDHYRAIADWWGVPVDAHPRDGQWYPGPGVTFVRALRAAMPATWFVAEDIGEVTDAFTRLLVDEPVPGMRMLQQGLDEGEGSKHLPDQFRNGELVAYTATHDHDTMAGWFAHFSIHDPAVIARACALLECEPDTLVRASIDAVLSSNARLAVIPMQDWLVLGTEARTNLPGTITGNWAWRVAASVLDGDLSDRMTEHLTA
ncbi:MAG: 4-alpha-glucanotransferase, partial [Thermoleophilia bacterium]|nr:4-alpha-glucanotransferase [Thermoleophilia bacterium]